MKDKIFLILKERGGNGLTITELVELSKMSRSFVRTSLARLEGAEKVFFRKIGMAKVYYLRRKK